MKKKIPNQKLKVPTMNSVLVIVYSPWKVTAIFEFLEKHCSASPENIGAIKIFKYKQGTSWRETNKVLMLVTKELWKKCIEMGFNKKQPSLDFQMSLWENKPLYYPKENETNDIFLSFPQDLNYKEIKKCMDHKMGKIVEFGLIEEIPKIKIITTKDKRFGWIKFGPETNIEEIVKVKMLLDQSRLFTQNVEQKYYLTTSWSKKK